MRRRRGCPANRPSFQILLKESHDLWVIWGSTASPCVLIELCIDAVTVGAKVWGHCARSPSSISNRERMENQSSANTSLGNRGFFERSMISFSCNEIWMFLISQFWCLIAVLKLRALRTQGTHYEKCEANQDCEGLVWFTDKSKYSINVTLIAPAGPLYAVWKPISSQDDKASSEETARSSFLSARGLCLW